MLLTTEALKRHQQITPDKQREGIQTYLERQQSYIQHYVSPNLRPATSGAMPGPYKDDASICSMAFTSSISEIIRRKQCASHQSELENSSHQRSSNERGDPYEQARPPIPKGGRGASNHVKGVQRQAETEASRSRKRSRQQQKSISPIPAHINSQNGLHLLKTFVSPNLQGRSSKKKPRVGLFEKGKSSAHGTKKRVLPDLVFSEEEFLKPQRHQTHGTYFSTATSQHRADEKRQQPLLSKYFKQATASPTSTGHSGNKTAIDSIRNPSVVACTERRFQSQSPYANKHMPSQNARTQLQVSHHHNKSQCSSASSCQSILKLLNECQEIRISQSPSGTVHYLPYHQEQQHQQQQQSQYQPQQYQSQQQYPQRSYDYSTMSSMLANQPQYGNQKPFDHKSKVPLYAHTRTPEASIFNAQYTCSYTSPKNAAGSPSIVYLGSRPTSASSSLLLGKPRRQKTVNVDSVIEYYQAKDNKLPQADRIGRPPNRSYRQDVNWQVADSAMSLGEEQEMDKDDLEFIMRSPAMNILNQRVEQNENDLQNFWTAQPYKRKL